MVRAFVPVVASILLLACGKSTEAPTPPEPASAAPRATAAPPASAPVPLPPSNRPFDIIPTAKGDLRVTPLHHATVMFEWGGKTFYVDPAKGANFDGLPKADVVLITDIHPDHLDLDAIGAIKKDMTVYVAPPAVLEKLDALATKLKIRLRNGDSHDVGGTTVEAVPMYNLTRGPSAGALYHDKGRGDGYIITFADKRIYLSGDTECTDEMRALKDIDVAFVCMNLPYTMPPSEAAACVKAFRPKIVYPYHYRDSNLADFKAPLANEKGIEIRERAWY
jgi:L-ascorbate metabolism protein UlaG (beta-lactamase superfamily)